MINPLFLLFLQILPWLIYFLFGYRFLGYISKHSIALYSTRGIGAGDKKRLRVFLQNLEDVDLDGGYRLRIEVFPHDDLQNTAIRAGPKDIKEDSTKLHKGIWDIYFDTLPALDTWLFELDAPEIMSKVVAKLQPALVAAQDERAASGDAETPLNLAEVLHLKSLPKLATDTLVLERQQPWAVAGSYSTPRWATTFLLAALAIAGYFLAVASFVPGSCSGPVLEFVNCSWSRIHEYSGWVDLVYAAALVLAAILYRFAASRQPIPIAQGYLERTIPEPYQAQCNEPKAPEVILKVNYWRRRRIARSSRNAPAG
ncbi:hypothetical protein DFR29_104265 [Tahibacter aquaticus]|uniref:Uncharacterized protein n=1 Tax=Tahibacter aquaticus TaxID=520092 RepID=A0A4R6Z2K5_9GAMM|nr:hypothetical protein [Tahibacter aquaticus]TDR45835.1 hypothetical protein DFR29_104265 [Tahibacter aquaticus]